MGYGLISQHYILQKPKKSDRLISAYVFSTYTYYLSRKTTTYANHRLHIRGLRGLSALLIITD
jgi:hypothetical protein